MLQFMVMVFKICFVWLAQSMPSDLMSSVILNISIANHKKYGVVFQDNYDHVDWNHLLLHCISVDVYYSSLY